MRSDDEYAKGYLHGAIDSLKSLCETFELSTTHTWDKVQLSAFLQALIRAAELALKGGLDSAKGKGESW